MLRKTVSIFIAVSILLISNNIIFAQSQSDWSAVESLAGKEAAIKTNNGKINYGIIKSVNADNLVLQTVGNKNLSQNETALPRTEIKKVWRALLFVNDRNIGKGALIGAGAGAGIAAIAAATSGSGDEIGDGAPLTGAAIILGALGGAAIGGVVGIFVKTKHKKRDLVYKQ